MGVSLPEIVALPLEHPSQPQGSKFYKRSSAYKNKHRMNHKLCHIGTVATVYSLFAIWITPMSARTYLDFDLQIDELTTSTFRARLLNSPAGQAEAIFEFPFTDQELEIFFLRIGRPRRGVRRINSPEMNEARNFGSKLYKAVFQDTLQSCLLRSIDKAEQQGTGLRLRLRLPPALVELPWEYLYDSSQERFLSHSTSTPIVRYLDLAQSIKPLAVTLPLKVLVMIASPSDYEVLDIAAEWQKIEASVAELKARGLIQLTRLPQATLNALQKQLRREQYHIFHFIGHGGFDRQTQEEVLLLENEDGRSRLVSGNALGTLLHDHPSLRLALLNACEGARVDRSDPFAGVAQQLVRQGIPAVIAMQFEITDKAAILLAREFYDALADGYPVDSALAEARKALFTAENDIEWGTPVLYLRAQDGNFFNIAHLNAARAQMPPLAPSKVDEPKAQSTGQAADGTALPPADLSTWPVATPIGGKAESGVSVEYAKENAQEAPPPVAPATAKDAAPVERSSQPTTAPASKEAQNVQVALPKNKKPAQKEQTPSTVAIAERPPIEFDWVVIPAGEFLMGSDKQKDPNAQDDELPQHRVFLSEYAIARVPVTNAQYKRFVDAAIYAKPNHWMNGAIPAGLENHPVVNVSWQDVQAFCQWAKVRLPTEAEWEKAARGTDGRIYPWGNEPPTADNANFSPSGFQSFLRGFQSGTTPVGKYLLGVSPYGLLDMAGNVWERVADWYDAGYYKSSPAANPIGPPSRSNKGIRGGSYRCNAGDVRSSRRGRSIYDWSFGVGFRVVRSVSSGS